MDTVGIVDDIVEFEGEFPFIGEGVEEIEFRGVRASSSCQMFRPVRRVA